MALRPGALSYDPIIMLFAQYARIIHRHALHKLCALGLGIYSADPVEICGEAVGPIAVDRSSPTERG